MLYATSLLEFCRFYGVLGRRQVMRDELELGICFSIASRENAADFLDARIRP